MSFGPARCLAGIFDRNCVVTEPRSLPSDYLGTPVAKCDPEFLRWCSAMIDVWKEDPAIELEWMSLIDFFDAAFANSEMLIRSAEKK
jgi:hypothetical protein